MEQYENASEKREYDKRSADASGLIRLGGTVERVIFSSDETGYAVCDFSVDEYIVDRTAEGDAPSGGDGDFSDEVITILGTLPLVGAEDGLTVYGRWIFSPKYGRQFRVEQYEKNLPADTASRRFWIFPQEWKLPTRTAIPTTRKRLPFALQT